MYQLTTPIPIPNVTRIALDWYRINEDSATVLIQLRPSPAGQDEATQQQNAYDSMALEIRNAPHGTDCVVVNPDEASNKYRAAFAKQTNVIEGAFDHVIEAIANATPKTKSGLKKAVLTSLVADGILLPGTV